MVNCNDSEVVFLKKKDYARGGGRAGRSGGLGSAGERGVQADWGALGSGAFRRTGFWWVLVSSGGERFPH